jgi:hypothetical protein
VGFVLIPSARSYIREIIVDFGCENVQRRV